VYVCAFTSVCVSVQVCVPVLEPLCARVYLCVSMFTSLSLCVLTGAGWACPGLRLIALSETERVWMTEDQVLALRRAKDARGGLGLGFMDVTDAPVPARATFRRALPTGPSQQAVVLPLTARMSAADLTAFLTTFTSFNNRVRPSPPAHAGALDPGMQAHMPTRTGVRLGHMLTRACAAVDGAVQYYTSSTGVEAMVWLRDYMQAIATAAGRNDTACFLYPHTWAQSSVICRVNGIYRDVCSWACMFVSASVYLHLCVCMRPCVCMRLCVYVCVCVRLCVYVCVCI
jgi:hypothetical protein